VHTNHNPLSHRAAKLAGKLVAAVSLLTAFGLVASPSLAADNDLGTLDVPSFNFFGNAMSFDAPSSFTDTYSFEVASTASLQAIISTIIVHATGISDFMMDLKSVSTGTVLATGTTTTDGVFSTAQIAYSPLQEGSNYLLRVTGMVDQTSFSVGSVSRYGAAYGGSMAVSPAPEPEIYAMMTVGLAVMGWVGRRKRKQRASTDAAA
jgi:PEP-CTERM motif